MSSVMSGLPKDFDFPRVASRSQEGQEKRRLKVTLLSSEWRSSTDGDLSTINRELAIQLAKHSNVEVSVFLPQCSKEEKNNAASHDVQLVVAEMLLGMNPVDCLMFVPDGHVMDCVVGHGVTLGKQVQSIRKHHCCNWIQVVHTAPEELGMYKSISKSEEQHKTEVALCKMADQVVAIGPRLADTYKRYLRCSKKEQNVFDITPGIFSEFLDVEQATEERRTFHVLVFGSGDCCEDFVLKGFDLAAQAIAELNDKSYQLKFVGAPRGKGAEIAEKFLQHGIDCNQLLIHSFSDSREVLADILCEVDLAIMPSKTEGFGVNALEALSAGLPVLVSGNSGFGEALKEVLFGSQFVIDSEDPKDWAREIKAVRQKKRSMRLAETKFLRQKYLETYSWEEPIRCLVERMHGLVFGLDGRSAITTKDKRSPSTVFGDHHAKQLREGLLHFDHCEALKGSPGSHSSHPFMEYQNPSPRTSLTQDKPVQERSYPQGSIPVIATGDKRPASTILCDHRSKRFRGESVNYDHHEALKGSSVGHLSRSLMDYGRFPLPSATVIQKEHVQQRTHIQGSSGDHLPHSSMDCRQCPLPSTSVTHDELVQERSPTQNYPEKLVELIRREYKGTVLCPFSWCEDELLFELSKIFTRLTIVRRKKERAKLTNVPVKMTDVFRSYKACDCRSKCDCELEKPRVVLIEGPPGIGKTTYCQKLAFDWSVGDTKTNPSFPNVDMLLQLTCRDVKTADIEDAIDDQLLPIDVDKKDKEKFFHFIRHNQTRILLVLDGLDELPKNLFKELLPFIKGRVFPSTYVMLTARHEVGMKVRQHCDALFEIEGYTKDDADSYIEKYFRKHKKPSLAEALIEEINKDSQLRELTANALNTALLCLVFEDTNGVLPYNRTMLYSKLVSCVLRRYCSKEGISLDDEDPVEKYTDQLNQLGKQALQALLTDQLAFTLEALKSQSTEFLELGFLSRQASASKIKLKPTYAFIHKTFQEYFAAFHLAHEVKAADREKATLLTQLSPVDKYWQVWEFLITTAAIKNDDIAVLLVSSLWDCSQHQEPDELSKRRKVIDSQHHDDVCRDTIHEWKSEVAMVGDEVSIIRKIIDAIARCEKLNSELKPYQVRMADTLARCAPKEKVAVRHGFYHTALDSRNLLVLSEYLKGNRKLKELAWFENGDASVATTIALILQTSHTLTRLHLTDGSYVTLLIPALHANHTLTHLNMRNAGVGDVEVKALGKVLQSNHTLTHLCLAVNEFTPIGVDALAEALKCNSVLENLNIGMNYTGDKGAVALSQALESNRTLRCLNVCGGVSRERIGDQGLRTMAHALRHNNSLTYLNIQGHSFSDPSLTELGKALQSNCSLTHLKLGWVNFSFFSGTRFGDSSAVAFSKALQSRDIQLTRLDLRRTSISSPCVIILAEGLRVNGTLERLDLSLNHIDCPGAIALAQALKTNQTLTHLQLRENKISDVGAKEFAEVLQYNKILIFLGLQNNQITESGRKLFKGCQLEIRH